MSGHLRRLTRDIPTRCGRAWLAGLLTVVCGVVGQAGKQPTFRSIVEVVRVPITVSHRDRRVALGALSAADFRVREDGQDVQIIQFERDARPLRVTLALDVSSSMSEPRQSLAADTVRTITAALDPSDEISLMPFADWPLIVIPWTRVGDLPGLDWAQWVLPADTAIFDAVASALGLADTSTPQRHVVIVVSDGFENTSTLKLSDLVKTRQQSEVAIYAMRVNPVDGPPGQVTHPVLSPRTQPSPRDYLPDIVEASGGLVYNVGPSVDYMTAAVLALVSDLRSQYLISYETPRQLDGKYRRIRVDTRTGELRVRHRAGYLALPSRPQPPR